MAVRPEEVEGNIRRQEAEEDEEQIALLERKIDKELRQIKRRERMADTVTVQLRGEAYAREPTPAVRERIETLYRQAGWKSCKLEWKRIKDKVWLNDYDSDDITGYIIDVTLTRQEG